MRDLAFWATRPVRDNGGVFSIGYRYPNQHMAQGHNAPGSPMWALTAFACLGLPESDPFRRAAGCRVPAADTAWDGK